MTWHHRSPSEAVTADGRWLADLPDGTSPWNLYFCDGNGDIVVGFSMAETLEHADRMIASGDALVALCALVDAMEELAREGTGRAHADGNALMLDEYENMHERVRIIRAEIAMYAGACP